MSNGVRLAATLSITAMLTACARPHPSEPKTSQPDMAGVLRIAGRFNTGHACPISETLALTSAHVIDVRPFDRSAPLVSGQWSDGDGHTGLALAQSADGWRDLGTYIPNLGETFPHVFQISKNPPKPGDKLFMLGYDFRSKDSAFADRVVVSKLIRIHANHLVFDQNPDHGSSGGCVFNSQGEVVGIVEAFWKVGPADSQEVGYAVGVWGDLLSQEPRREQEDDTLSELRRFFGPFVRQIQ